MLKKLKALWLHLVLPIVIGIGMLATFLRLCVFCAFLINHVSDFFLFAIPVAFLGVCVAGGFLARYFTGLSGMWYKSFLTCPATYFPLWMLVDKMMTEARGEFWKVEMISIALFPFLWLFCWGISYLGAFFFSMIQSLAQDWQRPKS